MTKRPTRTRVGLALVATLALVGAACGGDDDAAEPDAASTTDQAAEPTAEESGGEDTGPATDPTSEESAEAPDEPTAEEEPAAEPSDGPFKIAIVAPSAQNDLAFTQSIVDSVSRVGEGREIEVDITDGTFVVEDAAAAIRGYAEDGFDLVIAHGSQFGGPLQEIAPDFPEVAFAWGTAADTFGLDNVSAYTVRADEGGYVNGVIAAQLSETNQLGVVGPIEVGDAKLYVDGFVAGVAAQNPDATANVNYIESFSDVALASEAANAFITNGADVLTGTAQMVVGATGVALENDVPWFGTQSNQTALGESIVVASQVYHWEVLLNEIIDAVNTGTLGGTVYTATLANGGIVMEFNDAYGLDGAVRTSADDAIAGLSSGDLSTGVE